MDKYKKEIEHYGMLYDYNDSEDYLRQNPHLACDDTANYLALWCINLEVQEVHISNSMRSVAQVACSVFLFMFQVFCLSTPFL